MQKTFSLKYQFHHWSSSQILLSSNTPYISINKRLFFLIFLFKLNKDLKKIKVKVKNEIPAFCNCSFSMRIFVFGK